MKRHIASYFDNAISILLLVVAGLTPLLFFNQMTEFFEMPKLVFLIVSTVLIYGLWIFSCIIKGKVAITRTPLDIPLLLLLAVVLLSTFLSDTRFASIYGSLPKVHGSAVSWVTYILLYFAAVSNLRGIAQVKTLLYTMYGSATLVALISLLSYFNVFMPYDFAQAVNFSPTGSSFSAIAFLLLMLPLPLLSLLQPNKYMPVPLAIAFASLFGIVLVLIGNIGSYVALVIAIALTLFVAKPQRIKKTIALFVIPVALMVATLALAYTPGLPAGLNGIQQMNANFPKEIQLPFSVSWQVSASAFRDAPFVGTGPSTYLFNFTSYKPLEFNSFPFWNFSFDTAYNEYLQVLGTLGVLGLIALLFASIVIINNARKNLSLDAAEQGTHEAAAHNSEHAQTHTAVSNDNKVLLPALAITGVLSVVLLAIHGTTLVSIVVTLFMLAALMMSQKSIRSRVMMLSMGINASTSDNRKLDLFPIIIFIVFLVGAVPAMYKLYNVVAADYYHRQALASASTNGTKTYEFLQKAESLNPEADLYRVDMAQTNFALANALAAQKGPTQQNPEGSLTDQDRQTIQTLLSQAINESRAAVALSPRSSRNWEVLASIYRNISGVAQNALVFSLDSYGRAIQRDPLNPALRVNVGGIYYSIQNYDLAIRFFSDAANLKPDYANAYFNLAIALREKGDNANARAVAQQTVKLLSENKESNDYKIAAQLLKDLDARVATGSAAPAAASQSALQNPELGEVDLDNLQNTPSVTPAPSVRPNPNANLPEGINEEDEDTQPTQAPARR